MQAVWIVGDDLEDYMAQVFASLAERPRTLFGKVEGAKGDYDFNGKFGGRYLSEHPIPMRFTPDRPVYLLFRPTSGGRTRVYRVPDVPFLTRWCHRMTQLWGE
ncbi:MAG: hypothetical protein IKO64_00880 [Kiritimatiellae bacterium]|nr:hypothetical protein [Kiritimatiellia bacterium]